VLYYAVLHCIVLLLVCCNNGKIVISKVVGIRLSTLFGLFYLVDSMSVSRDIFSTCVYCNQIVFYYCKVCINVICI
jgi:hypothetical protein